MKITFLAMMVSVLLITALNLIFILTAMKMKFCHEKFSIYECGLDLLSESRLPFSLHFFFISIIFLIFDVELMMILPFIFCMKTTKIFTFITMMILLIIILLMSLFYEWWSGLINWMI